MKKIEDDEESSSGISSFMKTDFSDMREVSNMLKIDGFLYLGSVTCWGVMNVGGETKFNEELTLWGFTT